MTLRQDAYQDLALRRARGKTKGIGGRALPWRVARLLAQQTRDAGVPVDVSGLADASQAPDRRAEARELLARLPPALVADALGRVTLTVKQRHRLRKVARRMRDELERESA